jgi:type V secretory pathway adhesin AidA
MASVRVKLNHRGMRDLLNSSAARAALEGPAQSVLVRAKATAPVDTGAYRDSLHIAEDRTDRVVLRIGSNLDYATTIQANTGHLARAL